MKAYKENVKEVLNQHMNDLYEAIEGYQYSLDSNTVRNSELGAFYNTIQQELAKDAAAIDFEKISNDCLAETRKIVASEQSSGKNKDLGVIHSHVYAFFSISYDMAQFEERPSANIALNKDSLKRQYSDSVNVLIRSMIVSLSLPLLVPPPLLHHLCLHHLLAVRLYPSVQLLIHLQRRLGSQILEQVCGLLLYRARLWIVLRQKKRKNLGFRPR